MKTTFKTLSALALAAATLTAVTLTTGSTASANPFRSPGHGPVVHGPVVLGGIHGVGLPFRGLGHGPVVLGGLGHGTISCFACNLPRPNPPHWGYFPGRFPRWGYFPRYGYNWWGYRYNRWYWERHRDRYGFQGRPGEIALAAAPVAAPAPVQTSAGPQSCLTEQRMADGSVVFEDVCRQISAIAPPPSADSAQQTK